MHGSDRCNENRCMECPSMEGTRVRSGGGGGGANGAGPSVKLYNGALGGEGERTAGMRCCAICPNA